MKKINIEVLDEASPVIRQISAELNKLGRMR